MAVLHVYRNWHYSEAFLNEAVLSTVNKLFAQLFMFKFSYSQTFSR